MVEPHCTAINQQGPEMYSEVAYCNDGPTWIRDADGTTVELISYDQKYVYIRDDEGNVTFCPSGLPAAQAVEERKVEFHLEKTTMESSCNDLEVKQRVFVPQHIPLGVPLSM